MLGFEANTNYDNHPRGGGGGKQGDVIFFTNLNYAKIRDNYMQVYNKQIKTIAYNLKELGKRECKHESLQWFGTSLPTSTLLNLLTE